MMSCRYKLDKHRFRMLLMSLSSVSCHEDKTETQYGAISWSPENSPKIHARRCSEHVARNTSPV